MRPRTFAALAALVAVGAAVRAHGSDMRRMRESGIATRNFLAGVMQERERQGLPRVEAVNAWDPALRQLPTLEEVRALRGWNSGAGWKPSDDLDEELAEAAWWETTWPIPDRLEDEGDGQR